ncbi:hypothetical protein GSI_08012 [Ganoderma sinense ZZ0214-1]|uniref:Uncharacterized protein n=1 Tax=Ganoderma sinense ZZ0214-1 TaxID=1077348 RepID=A0A2G8S7Q3_9APHY|nr:hypothetical protein GSI_08012 [Ganoderma sinense ZZ0214-1]
MTPSFSANSISRAAMTRPATPQRVQQPPALYMRASCPEFRARDHSSSSSGMEDEDDELVLQRASYGDDSTSSDVEIVEVQGAMLEMEIRGHETVYRTRRLSQVEFTSPRNVILHSTVTTGTPSPSPPPSRGRALAKIAGKAKGIAKMLSLRRLTRKPSMEEPIPLVSSSSTAAVSGTLRDGAGRSGRGRSQPSPRRPPISILVTSESRTDAVTYLMSPNARIMSSSSTTGIYTPDDDELPHDDYPQSPTPSLTSSGANAVKQLERVLLEGDGDVCADSPSRRPTSRAVTSSRNIRVSNPLPAPNTGTIVPRARSAPPTAAAQGAQDVASPTHTPFPNLLRIVLFMPWCIVVGATITLFPAHIERVVFASGYIPAPSPRGMDRFCFWADSARDYARIFAFSLLSLFIVSPRAASIAWALVLARFMWVWGAYACASGKRCCCVAVPERLGEDDMESLMLIARGGDVANLVLRQCADHSCRRQSTPGHPTKVNL